MLFIRSSSSFQNIKDIISILVFGLQSSRTFRSDLLENDSLIYYNRAAATLI